MSSTKTWVIPILSQVKIMPVGIFLTSLHTVNTTEIVLKEVKVRTSLWGGGYFKVDFFILNNGLFPQTLKRPKMTCYLCNVNVGSESFDGIIEIDRQSFVNKTVEIKMINYDEMSAEYPKDRSEFMKEELTFVLEADCSSLFYQSPISITFGIKMKDVEYT